MNISPVWNQNQGQTVPYAWKCPKTQFWGPLTNWKVEPSPRPPTHSDPTINKHTEQVKKLCMGLSWWALSSILQVKTLYCTEKQGFGYLWLSKNTRHSHQNLPSFRKVSSPPAKLYMLCPTHLLVSEFWLQIYMYSLWQIEAYCSICPKF